MKLWKQINAVDLFKIIILGYTPGFLLASIYAIFKFVLTQKDINISFMGFNYVISNQALDYPLFFLIPIFCFSHVIILIASSLVFTIWIYIGLKISIFFSNFISRISKRMKRKGTEI